MFAMELINAQKADRLFEKNRRFYTFLIAFLVLLCMLPSGAGAQVLGTVITYEESISYDEEEGKLFFPSFVVAESSRNEIYVIDGKGRAVIYTSDFFPLFTLDKKNGIRTPQGLAIDAKGNIYVAQSATDDNPRNRISVLSACLRWKRDIYLEGFEGAASFVPYRLAVDRKGNIYVAASFFPGVLVLDPGGRFLEMLSPDEDGRKVNLTNVTIDGTGRIYLVSEEAGRIYVYDENRKFIFKFGEKGGSSGKLSRPKAVGVDTKNGRMYVVDYMRHAVSVYDSEGTFIFEFGGLGWGEGWFQHPIDLAVDSKGRIYVADLFNHRVQVFNSW